MAYCEIYDEECNIVKTSGSLRGIIDYSRRVPVKTVKLFNAAPALGVSPALAVVWEDGAATIVQFADATAMRRWAETRKCFKGAEFKQYP